METRKARVAIQGVRTILLVDESDKLHEHAIQLLELGYAVEFTHSGPYALEKLDRKSVHYDALMIGQEVRGMSQMQLDCAAREMEQYPNLVILWLWDGVEDNKGVRAVLVKNTVDSFGPALEKEFARQLVLVTG